jgi:hypothetical protein
MRKAAVLFQQLATWAEWGAGLTNDDLGKLIEELEQAGNSDRAFRQMEGLRTYLPAFGGAVGDAAKKTFPKDPGGPPLAFKNREEERAVCQMILKYIAEGKSEFRAKKLVRLDLAKKQPARSASCTSGKAVSKSTIDRLWARHGEILNEPSGEEFIRQLLQAMFTAPTQQGSPEELPNQRGYPKN